MQETRDGNMIRIEGQDHKPYPGRPESDHRRAYGKAPSSAIVIPITPKKRQAANRSMDSRPCSSKTSS